MSESELVAVYGTLKEGGIYHNSYMKKVRKVGEDRIKGFELYDNGIYPIACKTSDKESEISVEIYETDKEGLNRIDYLEGYPNHYKRDRISTKYGKAWIYFQSEKLGEIGEKRKIEDGNWKVKNNGS